MKPTEASTALAQLLRDGRRRHGWSLREVESRTASIGMTIPFSTLAKIERGDVDPGVARLHRLLSLYQISAQTVADLFEMEEHRTEAPQGLTYDELYRRGVEQWNEGNTREAIGCLHAAIEEAGADRFLRDKARLAYCVKVGNLGKARLSLHLAEQLLGERPDEKIVGMLLLQLSEMWTRLGVDEAALAFVERAERHAGPDDDRYGAMVLHSKAVLLSSRFGRHDEALSMLQQARALYVDAGALAGACRTLIGRMLVLRRLGDYDAALVVTHEAKEIAASHGFLRILRWLRIYEAHFVGLKGDPAEGLCMLQEVAAEAVTTDDKITQFYCHFYMAKGYEQLGDTGRAAFERDAAKHFARFVEESTEEFTEIKGG